MTHENDELAHREGRVTNGHAIPAGSRDGLSTRVVMIAHELRNSLAVVHAAARVLCAQRDSDQPAARAMIERHLTYINRHIDDLLQTQPAHPPHSERRLRPVDLRTIARHASDAIEPDMIGRKQQFRIELPRECLWANADAARLEQAISNLLINASKYTPDGGQIRLTLERQECWARLRIRDNGIGIEDALQAKVFDLFVQAGTAPKGRDCGHGIGLAVVRDIVEEHGGTVRASSAGPGQGSEFIVVLPALAAARDGHAGH